MKELPLKLDASITAQCLAFFRTAIIETTQSGQEWVSSHYNIFMDKLVAFHSKSSKNFFCYLVLTEANLGYNISQLKMYFTRKYK